jgi:hypothetical protein
MTPTGGRKATQDDAAQLVRLHHLMNQEDDELQQIIISTKVGELASDIDGQSLVYQLIQMANALTMIIADAVKGEDPRTYPAEFLATWAASAGAHFFDGSDK